MLQIKLKIPEDFFREEIRCGYTVSSGMKKVWAIELDLLAEFDRVCKKHHIVYYASGGTMLGAVRHKGFIPWDDDIDVMMMRDQYEKLCKVASEEFIHPYFFQTEYTDFGSMRGHAQLRNSLTTGILKSELPLKKKINQGIFIDIFPLDNVIDNEEQFISQGNDAISLKKRAKRLSEMTPKGFRNSKSSFKNWWKKMFAFLFDAIIRKQADYTYRKFEMVCQRYNLEPTNRISTLSFQFNNKQHIKYREDFAQQIEMPFEFMTIPVGANFEHALQTRYGDWKKIVMGGSIHGEVIFDAERSYKEYLMQQ